MRRLVVYRYAVEVVGKCDFDGDQILLYWKSNAISFFLLLDTAALVCSEFVLIFLVKVRLFVLIKFILIKEAYCLIINNQGTSLFS